MEKRRQAKKRKRQTQNKDKNKDKELRIITWNLQGISMRETNRRRLRNVIGYIRQQRWQVTLITELRAENEGTIWMGEEDEEVAIIHSKRSGIILMGELLRCWIKEGKKMTLEQRVTTIIVSGMRIISVYQPIWKTNQGEMDGYRWEVEGQLHITRARR